MEEYGEAVIGELEFSPDTGVSVRTPTLFEMCPMGSLMPWFTISSERRHLLQNSAPLTQRWGIGLERV